MKKRLKRLPRRQQRYRLISNGLIALVSFSIGVSLRFQANAASTQKDLCQTIVSHQAVLSRQQLGQLLAVPERENREAIDAIANEPYCTLPEIEVRAGVTAERRAYPLAFDPNTWLVVLYVDEEYAGYGFTLQH